MNPDQLAEAIQSNPFIESTFKDPIPDDQLSEFSKIDDERELRDKENILDLIIGSGEILESGLV